jgi:uncharacterized Tic20 family protein
MADLAPLSDSDARLWASLSHALSLAGYAVPLATVGAPLVIWLVFRERSALVEQQARESLNFQLTQLVAALVFIPLAFIGVGCVLLLVQAVFQLVVVIQATLAAHRGESYRYPLTVRLVS